MTMATKPLGKFEFDLLTFVAQHNGINVRTIHEQFGKPLGYIRGTIDKGIARLLSKGLVERELINGVYSYKAVQGKEDLNLKLVDSFIKDRLGGKLGPIAAYFAQEESLSPEEQKQLQELLEKLEK